jgi:hypothetical protein
MSDKKLAYAKIGSFISELIKKPIIDILKQYGKLFLVGGAIRSLLGDETPKDIDLFIETSYMNEYVNMVNMLEKSEYIVNTFLKRDYDKFLLNNLLMISIKYQDFDYDIVMGESIAERNIDFDVNSMYCLIEEHDITLLHYKDGKSKVLDDEDFNILMEHIKNKQMNPKFTIEDLEKNKGTVHGAGHMLKRFAKRINNGWNLVNSPNNIAIAIFMLENTHTNMYIRQRDKRETRVALVNLMKYLMNNNYDLKSFVDQKNWNIGSNRIIDPDYKKWWFSDVLNNVANKKLFDFNECMKLMEYCGIKYVKWENY